MRVAAIGHHSEHPEIEPVDFASDTSILDFDALVWDPAGLVAEYSDAYTIPGEAGAPPLLSVAASARLLQDVRRRRDEFSRFLERGRIMVVAPPPPVSLRIHIIEDIIDFHAFEALPQRFRLAAPPAEGVTFSGGHPFRAFAERVPARDRARAAFDRFPGEPLYFAGTAVAGGYVYQHPGHLLFLPMPGADGAGPMPEGLDDALLSLIGRIEGTGFNLDLPDWAADYLVPGEAGAREDLRRLLEEQESLARRLEEARQAVREADYLKALFAGGGTVFLTAIANIFQGFGTIVLPGLLSEDSVVVEDGERFLVVLAVDGEAEQDAPARLADRLDRFRDTFFSDAKGVVVHSRGVPPGAGAVNDVLAGRLGAEGQAYLTGTELLTLATAARDADAPVGVLDRIFDAAGRIPGLADAGGAVVRRS